MIANLCPVASDLATLGNAVAALSRFTTFGLPIFSAHQRNQLVVLTLWLSMTSRRACLFALQLPGFYDETMVDAWPKSKHPPRPGC